MIKRVVLIVLDSVGVGYLPDAHRFNDDGVNTLLHIYQARGSLDIPNLCSLGLGKIVDIGCRAGKARGCYGKMGERSPNKDTTTGHWEIAGVVLDVPFPTYPMGFPPDIIEEFERKGQENRDDLIRLEQEFEKDKISIEEEIKELDQALQKFEKKSRGFSDALDQELLRKYRFIRDRRAGQAVSPVVSGVCQTCHMGIPPQKFNELIRGNDLMTCPHCNRLIYWGEDEHFQEAQKGV